MGSLIATLEGWQAAATVAAYAALPDEPDLHPLNWTPGKTLLLPRVRGGDLAFHAVQSADDLAPGAFGILEPRETHRAVDPASAELILVPGLAFTREGARLGRGRGYYDRLLETLPRRVKRVGVCFAVCLLETLPVESHDQRVDLVVTENGVA